MNKIVFPALLVATIMVAGAFAFAPVEQASTIHSTGVLTSTSFAAGAVDTAAILDGTILTGDISTDTIIAADIAAGAVATSEILDATIVTADIATSGVTTVNILDDTIGPEDVTGVTAAAGFIHVEENTSITQVVVTTAFTPVVSSLAIVTCNVSGDATAAIVAGVITLTEDGAGTIQSTGARAINDAASGKEWATSATWVVTGITDATIFTCTLSGTDVAAADGTGLEIIAVFYPE